MLRYSANPHIARILLFMCLLFCSDRLFAQSSFNPGTPTTLSNTPQRDTNANKTNTNKWKNIDSRVYYKQLNSERVYRPDTSIHTFHRRPYVQPWSRDLGNLGSAATNLMFTPENRLGPTLGYHAYDIYRFDVDSVYYYDVTHPYTVFSYQLGSKLEQTARLLHSQNIKPNWNFTAEYHKINSPGYYKIQRTNHDNAYLSTNYKSLDQHYELHVALTYNKEQQDENGGITNDSILSDPTYSDRKTVPVAFAQDAYSTVRSSVTNLNRDFTMLLQHSYTWGRGDTLYNEDSTHYTYKLVPRFRITHRMELGTAKHEYKDLYPDSLRYDPFFAHSFQISDSVFSRQTWFWLDNSVLLNGFLGKKENQLEFNVGVGNRIDEFKTIFVTGQDNNNIVSNYLTGEIKKEALEPGEWSYQANAKFFMTGADAGDFLINAVLGKDIGKWGGLQVGFKQQLDNAPYAYNFYGTQYYQLINTFNKESVTQVYGTLQSDRFKLSGGVRNYLISNYIYIDETQRSNQYAPAFNLAQVWVEKVFTLGKFILDNELVFQQKTGDAPINVPTLLGRHQLSVESYLFKKALKVATGVEIRYHTAYDPAGYSPFLNRFYYQNTYSPVNTPEATVFFNFKIKRFRAYVMADQLQQLFTTNTIITQGYATQNFMVRFGFSWVMID